MAKKYLDDNGLLYFWGKLKTLLSGKADASSVPSKTSDLTNDSGYITINDVPPGSAASTTTPKMDGTAATGSENAFARGDHVHPTDTGRQAKITASGILKGDGNGGVTAAVAGTDYIASHQDISGKADKATTLSGYGITDAYTKTQVDGLVGSAYKPAGSVSTVSGLGSLTSANEGKVYNFSAAFTTTSDFVEGANHDYPSGTNVVIVNTASSGTAVYKYDVLSGLVDTSSFIAASDLVAVTNSEIDTVVAS